MTEAQKRYLLYLGLAILFTLVTKNLLRSRTGRALQAIRDRDIAAEVMGVPEFKYKLIAFSISSFFAGVAGALFASLSGQMLATDYSLFLSVEFIAILLIGGAGTVSGPLIGAFFVVMIPRFVEEFTRWLGEPRRLRQGARRLPAHRGRRLRHHQHAHGDPRMAAERV